MKITVKSVSTGEVFEKHVVKDYMNCLKEMSEKYLITAINKYDNVDLIDVYVLD